MLGAAVGEPSSALRDQSASTDHRYQSGNGPSETLYGVHKDCLLLVKDLGGN